MHYYIPYFAVISNLDSQRFELTHLRIDENGLQVSWQAGQKGTGLPHPVAGNSLGGHRTKVVHRDGGCFENILLSHLRDRFTRVPLPAYQADLADAVKEALL